MSDRNTAGIVLIGDELLSGKVVDTNGAYLIRELRRMGIEVTELHMVPDQIERIVEILALVRVRNSVVFTTGGIGPTHDDRTMDAVAQVVGEPLVRRPELVEIIRKHFGDNPETPWLKMADVPPTCELLYHDSTRWPGYKVDNIYVLPGIPEIFQRQFNHIRASLSGGPPFALRVLYLSVGEGELASILSEAAERYPRAAIGSYPVWDHPEYRVRVTVEAPEVELLETISAELEASLSEHLVRVEEGSLTI